MGIKSFEDLDCWKESRVLVNMVYELTKGKDFSKDFKLRDQIQSASVSGMSNIAEGFERDSNKDTIRFMNISLSSVTEVQSQLYIALDQKYIANSEFKTTYEQATKVKKIINGFIRYLNQLSTTKRETRNE